MKRLLTILVLAAFVGSSVPAGAITAKSTDKDEKKPEAKPTEQVKPKGDESGSSSKPADPSKSSLLNKLRRQVTESKSKPAKYDNFKDANKDGVSDNVQKPRTAVESAPAAAAPAKPAETDKPKATRSKDSSEKKKGEPN